MSDLNRGFNVEAYLGLKQKAINDISATDRDKTAVAQWIQGEEADVTIDGKKVNIGSDDGINMMEMVLASLAACDVAVVGLHASFMGIKLKSLRAEMRGQYNVAAMLGIENASTAGYDQIEAKIYIEAPEATPDQLEALKEACERGSPVGHTFAEQVSTNITIAKV
jgi:uncharacterized OsmC-like protein